MTQTLKELMITDVGDVFMNVDEHADTITRYPLGVVANAVSVVAIVEFTEATTTNEQGIIDMRLGRLAMSSDVTVHRNDTWLIDSRLYVTTTLTPPDMRGMQTVGIKATTDVLRNQNGKGVL